MPAIFTEQVRQEQELTEARRKIDAEQIACANKAKQNVIVYSWVEDGEPPNIHEFQDFTWLYFKIDDNVLSALELNANDSTD